MPTNMNPFNALSNAIKNLSRIGVQGQAGRPAQQGGQNANVLPTKQITRNRAPITAGQQGVKFYTPSVSNLGQQGNLLDQGTATQNYQYGSTGSQEQQPQGRKLFDALNSGGNAPGGEKPKSEQESSYEYNRPNLLGASISGLLGPGLTILGAMPTQKAYAEEAGESSSGSNGEEKSSGSPSIMSGNQNGVSNPYSDKKPKQEVVQIGKPADMSALAQADARIRRINPDAIAQEMAESRAYRIPRARNRGGSSRLPGSSDVAGRGIVDMGRASDVYPDIADVTAFELMNPQNEFEVRIAQNQIDNSSDPYSSLFENPLVPDEIMEAERKAAHDEKYNPGAPRTAEERQAADELKAEDYQNAETDKGTVVDEETGLPENADTMSESEAWEWYLQEHPEIADRYSDYMNFKIDGTAEDWYDWVNSPIASPHYGLSDMAFEDFVNDWFNPNEANSVNNILGALGEDAFYETMGYDPAVWEMLFSLGGEMGLGYNLPMGLSFDNPEEFQRLIDNEKAMAAYGALMDGSMHGMTLDDLNDIWNPLGYEIGNGDESEGWHYDDGTNYLNVDPNKVAGGVYWDYNDLLDYLDTIEDPNVLPYIWDQSTLTEGGWNNPNAYKGTGLPTAYTGQLLNSLGYGYRPYSE